MTVEGRPLEGKAALVTGASRGIGRAIAARLAGLGAEIGTIQRGASEWTTVSADLGDPEAAERAVEEIVERLGRLDICVCNAGLMIRRSMLETTVEEFRRILDVNLVGAFVVSRAAARVFVSQGTGGSIVHLASMTSFQGSLNVSSYAASKGGVAQLTKTQANEWGQLGIRVNAVAPGWVVTEMTEGVRDNEPRYRELSARIPLGRWASPEDVADVVAFLAGPGSEYVHGAILPVDGGYLNR